MNSRLRRNLERLLRPRHVAVVGGNDAAVVVGECDRIGFNGPVWPVNPRRREMSGRRCFATISELPESPDAVFVAVSRDAVEGVVAELAAIDAGGVVCYTAGFSEVGAEGAAFERALADVAGDLAIVGPNCYGLISFVHRVALWPFAHTGFAPGFGAAIVTQSGMLSSDLLMAQRSLPMAYMVSAGNQCVLGLDDFVDVFVDDPQVRAIGLHIEGLKDIPRFVAVAKRALAANVPIVVLKTGVSDVGARLTVSHTGSLSGSDDLYNALFDQLGVIRVESPAQLLETLKFLCVAGVPDGPTLAGFTCSGGGATMLADRAEQVGLKFPDPSPSATEALKALLPYTATVSNPLDYTTPIWGDPERLPPVLSALLADSPDVAVILQDYPLPGLDESKASYLNDANSFIACVRKAGKPGVVCSTLPENIDQETREHLIGAGVAPIQGIHECLDAIAKAVWYGERRRDMNAEQAISDDIGKLIRKNDRSSSPTVIAEWQAKKILREAGIQTPDGRVCLEAELQDAAISLGYPLALKWAAEVIAHKTERGAVAIGITSLDELAIAARTMGERLGRDGVTAQFLLERMEPAPPVELLLNVRFDPQFGLVLAIGAGGMLSELLDDVVHVLLPATAESITHAIKSLRCAPLLFEFRGARGPGVAELCDAVSTLANLVEHHPEKIVEIEINPLFVTEGKATAIDALIQY